MTLPFFVLACGARKSNVRRNAAQLYVGPLFAAELAYARSKSPDERILILSAKHGLLRLDTPVYPYDVTINQTNTAWLTRHVAQQIAQMVPATLPAGDITLLLGAQYCDVWNAAWIIARDRTDSFDRPLQGLPIGKQLQWLSSALKQEDARV